MTISIARCIETRTREAVYTLLAADSHLKELCGDRIYNGPLILDDSSLIPWQINVANGRQWSYATGVSGVTDAIVSIYVIIAVPSTEAPFTGATTTALPDAISVTRHVLSVIKGSTGYNLL